MPLLCSTLRARVSLSVGRPAMNVLKVVEPLVGCLEVTVESIEGEGSTFRLILPRTGASVEAA